jgi:hypothetical protein
MVSFSKTTTTNSLVNKSFRPLHVLILNAGLLGDRQSVTADGLEIHTGVNHLAGYYLATLLVDTLAKTVTKNKDDPLVGK